MKSLTQIYLLNPDNQILVCNIRNKTGGRFFSAKVNPRWVSIIGTNINKAITQLEKRLQLECKESELLKAFSLCQQVRNNVIRLNVLTYTLPSNLNYNKQKWSFVYYGDLMDYFWSFKIGHNLKESMIYLISYLQEAEI